MGISNIASNLRPGICTSTTRPTTPYEGQVIYETDTDMLAIWNGSAWRYIAATTPTYGTVLQILVDSSTTPQNTTSGTYSDTDLSISITPKTSTNKVLVMFSGISFSAATSTEGSFRVMRDSTEVAKIAGLSYNSAGNAIGSPSLVYLDSPSTTSAVIYKIQFKRDAGSGTFTLAQNNSYCSLTLMEIAG